MLATLLTLAIILWGAVAPVPVRIEFYQNNNGSLGQAGVHMLPDGSRACLIGIYEPGFNQLTQERRERLIAHEYGHCLGLGHYGSCNYNEAIMGCWDHDITDYDRFMLRRVQGLTYSTRFGGFAYDAQ